MCRACPKREREWEREWIGIAIGMGTWMGIWNLELWLTSWLPAGQHSSSSLSLSSAAEIELPGKKPGEDHLKPGQTQCKRQRQAADGRYTCSSNLFPTLVCPPPHFGNMMPPRRRSQTNRRHDRWTQKGPRKSCAIRLDKRRHICI